MSDGKSVIWTPDGLKTIGSAAPERVELSSGLMEWLRQFADFAQHFALGLHCSKCNGDLVGKNLDSERVFSAACSCREFIGKNRDWLPTAKSKLH